MRLNIGCGDVIADGWVNAMPNPRQDWQDRPNGVVPATLGQGQRLPWDDGAFDCAVANHVLQMLDYADLVPGLAELRRVLRPGGTLRLLVPNLKAGWLAYARGDEEWFPSIVGDESTLDGRFCAWVTWYGTARAVFTAAWLGELCLRAGFVGVATADYGQSPFGAAGITDLDSRPVESLILEARR